MGGVELGSVARGVVVGLGLGVGGEAGLARAVDDGVSEPTKSCKSRNIKASEVNLLKILLPVVMFELSGYRPKNRIRASNFLFCLILSTSI
jgi:hypothetical protein